MEIIHQAIQRAKAAQKSDPAFAIPRIQAATHVEGDAGIDLDLAYLQSRRIVAYDGNDPRSRPFDVLRTEILQSMDQQEWKILAVTSPTPSCGKTLVATNLALSMGRQPERQVLLVDLDVRKPQVAASLGLKCRDGVIGVIERRIELERAIVPIRAAKSSLEVLPTGPNANAADLVDAHGFHEVLRDVAEYARSRIVIIDLPPLLIGHDVISILPQLDCVLLVGAIGVSTVADIEECEKHLQGTNLIRFVLNKVPASKDNYAYY